LPRRHGAGPHLHEARQPDRLGRSRGDRRRHAGTEVPVMGDELPALSRRIAGVLAIDPSANALEFAHRWYPWRDLTASADAVANHIAPGERVAVLLRNRPAHVGLVLGLLRAGACVVTANPERGSERVRADLASLGAGTVAGEPADLEAFAPKV